MNNHYIFQAINANGESVYIDDVPNGKNCGCFCKECGSKLIAKQGDIKIHHFAHENGNDNIKCSETALHLLAKEIIYEEKKIPSIINNQITFIPADVIEKEKSLGDIKPDIYAEINGKPLAVEIAVSHPIDDIKLNKIRNHKITTYEIILSELHFESKEDIRKAIYDVRNIRPVYDELFTERMLVDKKTFIDKQGIVKEIINDSISQCPMKITVKRDQVDFSSVKYSLCKKCPFGYKSSDENVIHCVGGIEPLIKFSQDLFISKLKNSSIHINCDYWWQVSVTENKVVPLSQLAEYFSGLTNRKFVVNKNKKTC